MSDNLKSPLKTIRLHCLDCSGGSSHEVNLCPCETTCLLWPFRSGHDPRREKRILSDEARKSLAKRLARNRRPLDNQAEKQGEGE